MPLMRSCLGFLVIVIIGTVFSQAEQPVWALPSNYVIHVSVDGLGSSYMQTLINDSRGPNFRRFQLEGAGTLNARNDYDITVTLPNHVTMATSRGIQGTTGHNWTSNSDPSAGQTIHSNKGSYVASVFDVAHDNGLRTGLFAGKSKFSLLDTSYNATYGAADVTGPDNGRDKIDTYGYNSSTQTLLNGFLNTMVSNPYQYSFFHITDPDTTGHSSTWGSAAYYNTLATVDGYLGQILNTVSSNAVLNGHTTIILTADHGGVGTDHSNAADPLDYTIPFYAWGQNAGAGIDLYSLNLNTRLNPGTGRPTYSGMQPIRNGDAGNLALDLLGLGAIPGSTINSLQNLEVPEPMSIVLVLTALPLLARRR